MRQTVTVVVARQRHVEAIPTHDFAEVPSDWDPDIREAVEAGRISIRRARTIHARRQQNR